ncbi:MFS transporter [Bombilactobacillus bombi]|nr:MFS transporter [Bombilactobacillus bombi]AXX64545.1 MFS transporter [Bombilactobacillus bombi]
MNFMDQPVTIKTKLSILATGFLSFIGILIETSMNVTFPTLMKEFQVTLSTVQWVTTGYLLLVTIVMSTTSYLVKRFDARKIFLTAATMCLLGTIICAAASTFSILMLGRLLEAIATGLSTPTLFHIILSRIPTNKLGIYTGFATMVTSFAPALGPTYGGIINNYMSWRMIFIGVLPIIVIVMLTGGLTISLQARHDNPKFDFLGLAILAGLMVTLIISIDQGGKQGFTSNNFIVGIIITIILMLFFMYHLKYGKRQLLNFQILRYPIVSLRAINFFILQFMNIGISFVIPILAEETLKTNSMVAGLILLPGSILGAIISPIAGSVYDRKGSFLPLFISNISMLFGAILFTLLTHKITITLIMIFYCFMRGGFNFGYGNTMSDASKLVAINEKPDVNSLFNTLQQYAGSLGTGIMSAVVSAQQLNLAHNSSMIAKTAAKGCQLDFLILIILAIIALSTTLIGKHILDDKVR